MSSVVKTVDELPEIQTSIPRVGADKLEEVELPKRQQSLKSSKKELPEGRKASIPAPVDEVEAPSEKEIKVNESGEQPVEQAVLQQNSLSLISKKSGVGKKEKTSTAEPALEKSKGADSESKKEKNQDLDLTSVSKSQIIANSAAAAEKDAKPQTDHTKIADAEAMKEISLSL